VEEGHVSVYHGVRLTVLELLACESLSVCGKPLLLGCLELSERAIQESGVFARERADLGWQSRAEKEVYDPLVLGLYCPRLLSRQDALAHLCLDWVLLGANTRELIGTNTVLEDL